MDVMEDKKYSNLKNKNARVISIVFVALVVVEK